MATASAQRKSAGESEIVGGPLPLSERRKPYLHQPETGQVELVLPLLDQSLGFRLWSQLASDPQPLEALRVGLELRSLGFSMAELSQIRRGTAPLDA